MPGMSGIDASQIDEKAFDRIEATEIEGLFLLPSNIDLVGAELEMLNFENRGRRQAAHYYDSPRIRRNCHYSCGINSLYRAAL